MKQLNKIFGLGLATLSATPALAGISMTNNLNTSSVLNSSTNNQTQEKHYACTIAYIGKDCTPNKTPIIARATDCSPKAVHLKLKHFKRDEIAGKTLEGKLGLKYTMPEHTYAYTSCPLSDKTSDDPVWASGMWENNGINEMGVCTTATLTCATNELVLGIPNESFVTDGVGEELLPAIMSAQAATAKEAMKVAAEAIDKYGAQDANIIMASDQNEAWLMEIYSRHQYCAVKMPSDKVFTAGNEFILDSLNDLGINESNKNDMCITSAGLFDVVKNRPDIVRFRPGTTESQKDIFHLDLFNTYAFEGSSSNKGSNKFDDICHMRTWRGFSLFDDTFTDHYDNTKKLDPFLTPKDFNGNKRTDMTCYDVMQVYRDEFDNVVNPFSPKYDPYIGQKYKENDIRPIAVQTTRQVHIMASDPTKPKWMAANEWYCPSSANYTPYVQINNAIQSYDGEYGYYPERFNFDESCSSVLFRELNKLAWYDRKHYGYPLQDFWRAFEYVYITQMQQVTDDCANKSQSEVEAILTNFNKEVRDNIIKQVKKTKDDLMWHIMDEPHKKEAQKFFVPLVDLEQWVKELGWKNYNFDGSKVTFEKDAVKCTYTISDGVIYGQGTLELDNGTKTTLRDSVVNNKVYVDMATLNSIIGQYSEVRKINADDYLNKVNYLVWLIPLVCVVVIGAGLATFFIVRNKKKQNKKARK